MSEFNLVIPVNELANALADRLIPLLDGIKSQQPLPVETYLTRKQTAKELNVSLTTLSEYTKRNLITGYRFGVRVLYKKNEIEAALTKMNFGNKASN